MYCIQFLLPVLLLPRPLHPNQLFEHSLFLGKFLYIGWNRVIMGGLEMAPKVIKLGTFEGSLSVRSISNYFFSSLRILGISGNPPVPDLFDNISGLLGRSLLQLPWWMYFTPFMQLLKKNQTVLKTSSNFKKIWIQFWILERLYATTYR